MTSESLKELIKRELPALLRSDPALRRFILDLTRETYADRRETEDRFDRILEELRNDREEQARKWDANQAELRRDREERARVWDEYKVEQNLKWEDQNRKWDDQNRKWDEQNRKWDEQNLKWEDMRRTYTPSDTIFDRNAGHFDRGLHVPRPIINAGQHMTVKVDHKLIGVSINEAADYGKHHNLEIKPYRPIAEVP